MQHLDEKIEAKGPNGPLVGRHMFSKTSTNKIVLIIPGSGPTDHNGNNPLGVSASTYKLLAAGLANKGIQSVRFDKRGMFASKSAVPDANDVTISDYADDVVAWIDAIHAKVPNAEIWLLGHSEGGLVALVSAQRDIQLSGVIMVAAAGRKIGEILREQILANPANEPIVEDAMFAITQLEAGAHADVNDLHPAIQQLFSPSAQSYMIDWMSYDPAKEINSIELPILILQGDKDLQVKLMDANRLSVSVPSAKLVIIPNVNHVLKEVNSDSTQQNAETYSNPDLPIASEVLQQVVKFIDP